jgi:hypothetical protein
MSAEQFNENVHFQPGLLGISEKSSDMRDLMESESQNVRGAEAAALFGYQVKKWVSGFAAAIGYLIGQVRGCVSSNLVELWHYPSPQAPPLGKLLVIAVRKDATKRRIWEDSFASGLAKHGVAATSSYLLFPDAPPDTNQVKATIQANGFDGIMVVSKPQGEVNTRYRLSTTTTRWTVR